MAVLHDRAGGGATRQWTNELSAKTVTVQTALIRTARDRTARDRTARDRTARDGIGVQRATLDLVVAPDTGHWSPVAAAAPIRRSHSVILPPPLCAADLTPGPSQPW